MEVKVEYKIFVEKRIFIYNNVALSEQPFNKVQLSKFTNLKFIMWLTVRYHFYLQAHSL